MTLIGIIANPSSGKDIRRLVAEAAGSDNRLKVNIVRRVLLGIAAVGVEEVALMPDRFGIGRQALDGLKLPFRATCLDMPIQATQEDSLEAARRLRQRDAACIVVLGGDGTHRVVAKGCGQVPLVPISTGTNNVWPQQNEGTLAGLAAALVARQLVPTEQAIEATKRLEVHRNGSLEDIALVDVATCDGAVRGSKAVWDVDRIREIALSSVRPGTMGLSSIGGGLLRPAGADHAGLFVRLGPGGVRVLAPIAPGKVCPVPVQDYHWLRPGDSIPVTHRPCLLALDGERETLVTGVESVTVRLTWGGPRMVRVENTLKAASERGFFMQEG
jgi:hypothetical protein